MTVIQRTVSRTETYTTEETRTGTRSDGNGGTETYTCTVEVQKERVVQDVVTECIQDPVPPIANLMEEEALEVELVEEVACALLQQEDGFAPGDTVVTTDGLNVRSTPEFLPDNRNRIGTLPPAAELTVGAVEAGVSQCGDWVFVSGSLEGQPVTGWVHRDYLAVRSSEDPATATEPLAPVSSEPAVAGTGTYDGPYGPTGFIGGNYTDLGIIDGVYDPAAAAADLDRLQAEGITEVRVWATGVPGYSMEEDPQRAADRVASLAKLAADRGMTLVVDLFDGNGRSFAEMSGSMDAQIERQIETIVGDNAHFDNVRWSLGNELQGHENPSLFADWFTHKVGLMRDAAGDHSIHVTTQFVPGSAEHRWWADTEEAVRRIAESVDSVGVHFYPEGTVEGSQDWLEYRSLLEWKRHADAQSKPFIVGEFNVSSVGGLRSAETIDAWLDHLYEAGVDHVSLWQFMKDEGGHLDHETFDSLGGHAFLDTLRPWLRSPTEAAAAR